MRGQSHSSRPLGPLDTEERQLGEEAGCDGIILENEDEEDYEEEY